MQELDRLLNPNKRFLEYQDYLIDLISSSYHKSFKDLIATRIKDAFYFFDSTPDVTYQFIKEFNPNIKKLIKYYLLNKDYEKKKSSYQYLGKKYYCDYLKGFLDLSASCFRKNIDIILGLNFEVFSKEYNKMLLSSNISRKVKEIIEEERDNYISTFKSIGIEPITDENVIQDCLNMKEKLNYIYKACIIKDSLYGKSVMKKIEKLNIDSNILLYYIVGSIAFMENNTEARVKNVKTNQGKQKCILSFPVVEKYFFKCLDLDYTLLHELIHICEAEQDSDFSIFMTNENYHYFNEFRTDEKAIRLLSKLRQDNIYIFNQDNDSISTESDYNKFIPLIEPLLDAYRELIDYCAVTNEISPLYKTLGKENFDNYCKSLNDIYNEMEYMFKFLNEDDDINISSDYSYLQIDKMKDYSKRKTLK